MFSREDYDSFACGNDDLDAWQEYQRIFRAFWNDHIMSDKAPELDDSDIDPIIRMLDQNGKGNTKGSIVVAKAFIRMGMWYRAFRSLKANHELRAKFDEILKSENDEELITLLNDFEVMNRNGRNGLCGKNAVVMNAILCLNNPTYYVFAVSLDHREKILKYLYNTGLSYDSFGEAIIDSNRKIIDFFRNMEIFDSTRKITLFLYSMKDKWLKGKANETDATENLAECEEEQPSQDQVFVIEKYFEEFLIGNWESTELGKKYDLIYENNELVSQQYRTEIGIIDLLVQEKTTHNYVVIELKRNQTSDATVGQILRYIGWVKAKLSPKAEVKGVIIGYDNDIKLNYAIACTPNIDVLLYRIKFTLFKPEMSLA